MKSFIFDEKLLNKIHIESEKRIAREEGHAEGVAAGRAEGRAEGHAEGVAAGRAEGRAEAIEANIIEMLKKGLSVDFISDIVKLDPDEVKKIAENVAVEV